MGKYLQSNLSRDEEILQEAEIHNIAKKVCIVLAILFFWTIFFPIFAFAMVLRINSVELGFTNKRLMGKIGVISTNRVDTPLNKVDNITVTQGLLGKMLGYGTIFVSSTSGKVGFEYIKSPETFRKKLMEQIDQFDEERIRKQAEEMAKAMQNN